MHGFLKEELWKLSGNWVEGTSRLTTWQAAMEPPIERSSFFLPPTPSRNSITTTAVCFVVPRIFLQSCDGQIRTKGARGHKRLVCWEHKLVEPLIMCWRKFCRPRMHWKPCSGDVTWSMCAAVSSLSSGAAANIVLWAFVWARRHSNRRTNKQISRRHLLRQIKVHLPCRGDSSCASPQFLPQFLVVQLNA